MPDTMTISSGFERVRLATSVQRRRRWTVGGAVVSAQEQREVKRRIWELARVLGCKTLEVEILKEAIELGGVRISVCEPVVHC